MMAASIEMGMERNTANVARKVPKKISSKIPVSTRPMTPISTML